MPSLESGNAELFPDNAQVCSHDAAVAYATSVAQEAIEAYKSQQPKVAYSAPKIKGPFQMNHDMNAAINAVKAETEASAMLVTGEILLENIETVATNLVLSRLTFWQKLAISKGQKEMAITILVYALIHAIQTGGFGLTGYKVNHAALNYITLAANKRILSTVVKATGIDTNVAAMLFKAPTVEGGK